MRSGWQARAIGDVCAIKPPKSEARAALSSEDLVSFVPMEDLPIGSTTLSLKQERRLSEVVNGYTYFADGDVLLAKITPCFENGKLGIAADLKNGAGFGSSEYIVLRPDSTVISEWLYYYLERESFRREGAARMSGAVGHKRVPQAFIEQYPLPVPPLAEQRRIVAVLDQAFEAIEAAKANTAKNLLNAQELFESELNAALTFPANGKTTETTLGNEIELQVGFAFKSAEFTEVRSDVRLLRGDNIVPGALRWDGVKRYPVKDSHMYQQFVLAENDVVLAMDRPWVGGGLKRAQIRSNDLPCLLVQRVARMRGKAAVDHRFLYYLTGTCKFISHLVGNQTGLGVPHISGQQLKDFVFRKPTLQEQQRIATKLDLIWEKSRKLAASVSRKIGAIVDLKESLLNDAFAGRL